jgi:Zn-dependent protease with chaperone function
MTPHTLRQELAKATLLALLALFLVPGLTWGLAKYFRAGTDAAMAEGITGWVRNAPGLPAAEAQAIQAFLAAHRPSATCDGVASPVQTSAGGLCEPYSALWQFALVETVAGWTLVAGVALLALVAGLAALAFARRRLQLLSFLAGWRVLVFASAAAIAVQGAFAVWLSFWVTAYFFEIYILKIILVVAFVAAAAIFGALRAMFRRTGIDNQVQGERIEPEAAPALWTRLREYADRLGTAPPDVVVAGVDANFFVTEQALRVAGADTRGRALYVSLPLLRVLAQDEADAVLAHELGHFVGGDTEASAMLGPKLVQFDSYLEQMRTGGLTVIAFFVLHLYRLAFELALSRSSREREFAADRVAAGLVSADALARALVKVSAYALYRGEVEGRLFDHDERHDGQLGIGHRVAAGLAEFSRSAAFVDGVRGGGVPHPFDSHPPLRERMRNVGADLPEDRFADIVCAAPAATWIDSIAPAADIEARLWAAFEQDFAQAHEQSLAFRYEPADEQELALVLKYFPPVRFALKKGDGFEVNHAGLVLPDGKGTLPWDKVDKLEYEDNSVGADQVTFGHPEGGWNGRKSTKFGLAIPAAERDRVKEAMGRYWHRHQVMRAIQKEAAIAALARDAMPRAATAG